MKHPFNELFAALRERWLYGGAWEQEGRKRLPGRTSAKLAKLIGVRSQVLSSFATGSDARTPTLPQMMRMCALLDLQLHISAEEICVEPNDPVVSSGIRLSIPISSPNVL